MSGYSSDLNIRLGQMPEIKDSPAVFNELQGVYNAIHLLNAALNDVRRNFAAVDRSTPGWESFTFEGRSFWAPAANNVKAGDLVTMEGSQFVQGIKGRRLVMEEGPVRCFGTSRRAAKDITYDYNAFDFGFCLEETSDGLAHIGWPAAIVELEGLNVGDLAFARAGDPKIYSNRADPTFFPVGRVVAPDALLLIHNISDTFVIKTYVSFWDNCAPN